MKLNGSTPHEKESFEVTQGQGEHNPLYELKLFVTGMTPNSMRAVHNITTICSEHLGNNCRLEIIDVYQNAELAKGENIIATPTLVRVAPGPARRLVGDLSETKKVLSLLDIRL